MDKFCGSAQNSAQRGKLWSLAIMVINFMVVEQHLRAKQKLLFKVKAT